MHVQRPTPTLIAESGTAVASGLLFGYSIAAINTALAPMRADLDLSSVETGIVVSAVAGGALLGCVLAGVLMGAAGPRRTLVVAGVIAGLGSAATVVAESCGSMAAARAAIGAGVGIASVATPVFVANRVDPHVRGILLTVYQLSITVGILAALLVGWVVIGHAPWQWITGLNALPAIVLMICAAWAPADVNPPQSTTPKPNRFGRIHRAGYRTPASMAVVPTSRRDHNAAMRSAAIVAIAASLMNALTGVGLVMYFSTEIFALVNGRGGQAAVASSVLVGVANVVVSMAAVPLIARINRRPLLIIGLGGMATSLLAVAASLQLTRLDIATALAVIGTIAFMGFFAISAGPLAWVILSEVAPAQYRNVVTSSAVAANWSINLALTMLFPIIVGSPPDHRNVALCYVGFMLVSLGFAAFVWRCVPETRGLTLDEIQSRFRDRQVAREI